MAGRSYEVQVLREERWITETAFPSEDAATEAARKLVQRPGAGEVRVVVEHPIGRGEYAERVVFTAKGTGVDAGRLAVGRIDSAPVCERPEDLYGAASRQTVNRLFRKYLDALELTPSEIMHSHRLLKRALDQDRMVPSAVEQVARLQAQAAGGETRGRRDQLYDMVDRMAERARAAESRRLPSIGKAGFAEAASEIAALAAGEEAAFLTRVALARDLSSESGYLAKLGRAASWLDGARDHPAARHIDDFIADILANPQMVRELLGDRPDLASAILAMIDLADGRIDGAAAPSEPLPAPPPGVLADPDVPALMQGLLGARLLPNSRTILIGRAARELGSGNPLTKDGTDAAALERILDRVFESGAPLGGAPMAAGIVERQARLLNRGGAAGVREALKRLASLLGGRLQEIHLLLSYSGAIHPPELDPEILEAVRGYVEAAGTLRHVAPYEKHPLDLIHAAKKLFDAVGSSGLSRDDVASVSARIDALLHDFIVRERVFEKIDDPKRPLRLRAFMLLQFCGPDTLPDGRAKETAKQLIVRRLAQPKFDARLVEGIPDPKAREAVHRQFYALLKRAGF